MRQWQFAVVMVSVIVIVTVSAIAFMAPYRRDVDKCAELGGELIVVRAGKPICVRRDALIVLP